MFSFLLSFNAGAAALSEKEILDGADERIERYRKGDAKLQLQDENGKPLGKGVKVSIEQTQHRFLFGALCGMFNKEMRDSKPEEFEHYSKLYRELLNYATIQIFWVSFEPEKGKPNYDAMQFQCDWGRNNGITLKAHPLAWNWWHEPKFLQGKSAKQILQMQGQRITDIMTRFKGQVQYWDVVNEPSGFDRKIAHEQAPLLTSAILGIGGDHFLRQMYTLARKADPSATLLVNDFVLKDQAFQKRGIEPLLKAGKDGADLFDAIGYQSHMQTGTWPVEKTWNDCEQLAVYGKPIHFSETTILSGTPEKGSKDTRAKGPSTKSGEERQAREMAQFYTILFSHPSVEAITLWTWKDNPQWPAGLVRVDGTPKPVYYALQDLIRKKWWTKTTAITNDQGEISWRGFYGDYKVKAEVKGQALQANFTLKPGESDPVEVKMN